MSQAAAHDRRVALSVTTVGILAATLNSSILLISLPAIFRGLGLDPLAPQNISYLLWMLMGFLLVTAVLVVTFGRLGDQYGRAKLFNLGFLIFTVGSIGCALVPNGGGAGALEIIIWRIVQGVGGAMVMANSTAIITDAFPADRRGFALGVNQVSALAGSFMGLIIGGLLSEWDWRAVFWVSVPIGVWGTWMGYRTLHDKPRDRSRKIVVDWWGNLAFGVGLVVLLIGITYGLQPYGGHTMGWTSPLVLTGLIAGVALLVAFVVIEGHVAEPMVDMKLFRIRAFAAGQAVNLLAAMSRGGLQFMLIIWLQGIWLPLHGYKFVDTPLWAGIYMVPLTLGFLVAGPASGALSDRLGARTFATGGLLLSAATFAGLIALPADFNYVVFADAAGAQRHRHGADGGPELGRHHERRPGHLPRGRLGRPRHRHERRHGALARRVLHADGRRAGQPAAGGDERTAWCTPASPRPRPRPPRTPPRSGILFAAFLGGNPIQELVPHASPAVAAHIYGGSFFPSLISAPFRHGLAIAFTASIIMLLIAAGASLLRGAKYVHDDSVDSADESLLEAVEEGLAREGAALSVPAAPGEDVAYEDALARPGADT